MPGSIFDPLADAYDAARPSYPEAIYDQVEAVTGTLASQLVLDGCAGTGIATRQLAARGARTVALDLGERMLRKGLARSPGSCGLVADANALPLRAGCIDVACFAQSWHWLDPGLACSEVARVLRPGGYWAAWWNEAAADGEAWFDARHAVLAANCPGYYRQQRPVDWSTEPMARTGQFEMGACFEPGWTRTVRTDEWLTDERSKSYLGGLDPAARDRVLAQIADIIGTRFPDGQMSVRYRTRMWLARRR